MTNIELVEYRLKDLETKVERLEDIIQKALTNVDSIEEKQKTDELHLTYGVLV